MSTWNIYHKDGSKLTDVNGEQITVHGLEYSDSWMGECFVTINFKHEVPINFQIGDYIVYRGERFELNYEPGKDKQARPDTYGEGFVYDSVKFNALQDELSRAEFLDVVLNDNELHYTALPKFPFYVQTLDDLLDRIQANLDEQIGKGLWKIYSRNMERSVQRGALESEWMSMYGEGTRDNVIESMSITVDSQTCWQALSLVNEKWDINFIVRGRNVYVGTTGIQANHIFKYGLGEGLYEIVQNADSDQSVVTRLRAYGSEKNLPSHYYADLGVKYVANITKVVEASTNVELELGIDYIETYFKNKRKYIVSGESQEQSFGWVLQVTFDFQTIITGYVTQAYNSNKCRFYSELKGTQVDSGDEESKEKLEAFIAQVKAGNTKMYITSGLNKKIVPSSMKEYAENLPNNMSINRLMLPGFPHVSLSDFYDSLTDEEKKYVNPTGKQHRFSTDPHRPYIDSINIDQIGLRSASQFFDTDDKTNGVIEIYPTIEEMEIGGVRVDEIDEGIAPDDDGRFGDNETVRNVDIYLNKAIDFDINDLKDDDFSISMKDGMCGGRTFKVASSTKVDGRWRLTIERVKDDALELWFPYRDYPIKKGDHFVLTGITLPDSYVNAASLKLLKYAIAYLDKNDYTRYVYQPKVDELFMARQHDQAKEDTTGTIKSLHDTLKAGDLMEFEDTDLGIGGVISIDQLTIKEEDGKIPTYEITLREDKEVGTIQKIQQQISSLQSGNGGTGAGLTTTQVKNQVATEGSKHFISKINNDTAKGTVTWEKIQKFLQGLNIGDGNSKWSADGTLILFRLLTNNFSSGLYGQGAQIDEKGNIEANSIYTRQFISAPKFVYNEISVTKAEQWNTNGYGTIESVDVENRTITLHLEENDYGSLQVGDICRGLYADIDNAHGADKTEEGALDDCNFVQHKGFFTTYFYVSHIITSEKGKFVFQYGKKSSVTPDPCAYMDFAQYGSFTDEKRQSSMYFSSRGNSYIEVLDGVCTWEVQPQNRVARYGWLGGLALVKKDGSIVRPEGNGIYVQDNIYFGGNVNYLQGLSGLDDLREEAKAYDVSLSQYQSVITVDDMGNVINGLYTEDEAKTTKQYRISTAVFVRKGMDILLEEDGNTEDVTAGHYRVHAVSEDCEVMVQNSTIFVTAIKNIKDGVAGTTDDATFDYDAMRKATDAMVTIVVELEGKTSKMVQMPIRIQHDTLPFMVCDLSNESASVAWNTKTAKYIGLPIKTKVSLMYHNEPWAISSLNISKVAGLKTSMSIEGKAKVITIDADNLTADTLAQVTKMNITVVGRYAGANYEYTRELTILKSSDTVVYELIPSADSIVVDKDGNKTVNSVSCDVYATSSDDKRYKLTALPSGMTLKYGKSENATTSVGIGADVPVSVSDKMVTFALYDSNNNMLDKESVPVVAFGKDGKGIEYIFKLQDTAPSNPTPDNYATNTEYQRTDKEFVPSGWTDDPTGVTAANPYEWVCKRVSTNGHWGAFSEPAEYAHFGKHAPKAKSSDDIVTIPTDSNGNALLTFREEVGFSLLVDGHECNISSIQKYSSTLSNVSCSISSNVATIKCEEGAKLGITSQTVVFKVTGTLDGSSYIDYVTVKVVPNVTGADGDGYEYIYYLSSSSSASSIPTPKRTNGVLTNGWKDDPMAPTKSSQYVWVAYKKGAVGSDGTFSTPKLFNRYPRSIDHQTCKYLTTSSISDNPSASKIWSSGSTTMPTDFNDTYPWLWKLTRTFFTDNTTEDSVVCEGYKAKDGIGIKSVNTWYGLSSYMTSQPSSYGYDTLSDIVIKDNKDMYVWSRDEVTYTDNKTGWTGAYCIGKCSDLVSVREEYGTSTSDGTEPSSWSGTYPDSAPKGTYIWSRDVVEWKDGITTTSAAQLIGYIATDGLHAPKATCTDDKVTIPTDSSGNALVSFDESISFNLYVDGTACSISSVTKVSDTLSYVYCSISSNVARFSCSKGATLGKNAQHVRFKVVGTLSGKTYSDYVIVKVIPNVTGEDGDGYEYIYYLSSSSSASSIPTPKRTNGVLTNGWQDDPMSPTVDKQYVYVAYKKGVVGSNGTFSAPKLFNRFPKSISKQETRFYAHSSLTSAPKNDVLWNSGSTSMPTDFSDAYPWLWKIVRTTYTDGTTSDVVSCEGYKAKDGIGIKSVNTYYALSDDMEQPSTSKFTHDTLSEVVISNNGDKYVWSADKVTYTNTDIGWTGIYCIGKCSDLTSVIEEYGTSASDTNKPTSWSEKYPTDAPKGTYIWSRDKIVWKKGDPTYSTAQLIGYIAKDGENGVGSVVAYQREAVLPTQKPSVTSYDIYKNSDELGNKWQKSAPPAKEGLYSGGSISGTVLYNQNANGGNWQSGVSDGGYTWYKSPAVANNGIATMQIRFSTTVANQYVTFYIKAYSEANYDFILLSEIDSANVDRTNNYSFRVSGNGVVEKATLKCDKAGSHFVTVAYAKDVGGASFGDYGLVRMSTSENYVRMKPLLYRCDGEVASNKVIAWGNIYQAQGDKGDTGDKGDKGETGGKGDKGETGVGIASIQTYYLISSMSSGITTSSSGWSTNMVNPTSSKPYLWSYVKTTLSNGDITSSTPVIIGNFAEAGVMGEIGCIIRPSIWKSGVEYLNESALTNKQEKYIDLVYVEDASANDGWRQYMCALTHTSSSNNSPTSSGGSKYWTKLSDTGPIYAPLILAKNAVLNFTQGQQFNLVENGKIFASYRIPGSDGAALWLGGSTASSAPFSVDKNGSLKSTSGIIGGVEISQERLGVGVADVGNKTFKGAILSSEGIFTGYKSSYFGAGVFAADDPSGSTIQMYDKKALSTISVSSPSLYVRKYSPDSMILNNIDKYYGAALIVDVPKGVGVASLGNNVLGGLALSAVAGDLDIGSTDNLFQKNRGTVAYLTNSSGRRFYLPDNPHEGQVVIVIQGSTGNITFYHPGKRLVIQNTVKDSGGFYSGKQGQFNIFVYIGSMWYGTYSNG